MKKNMIHIKKMEIEQYDYVNDENEDKIVEKYAKSIGQLLIHFNNLDHELNQAISHIFCDDAIHQGYSVTKDLMFRNKVELFNDLYTQLIASTDKMKKMIKLNFLYNELLNLNTFRNSVIHANWLTLDEDCYVRTKVIVDKDDGWIKGKMIKITPRMIVVKSRRIDTIIEKISEFTENVCN